MSQPVVSTDKLCKWYGRVVGINDFSVHIPPGVTGLLGPNGAGKSTFIKLLVGALRPSKGRLTILGQPVWGNRALLTRVGYCPEHDGIYDDLSAVEFLTMLGQLAGLSSGDTQRRAHQALDRMELGDARHRRLGGYSKGMRQRAKLAQAIMHQPEVLLLDEPLTGCDPLARVKIIQLIKELGEAGKTVIVSSHILHEVESMTSEIVLVFKGQVLAEGNVYGIREMIDDHPHKIQVECDAPRALAQHLVASPHVRRVDLSVENVVTIETPNPDDCYPLIPQLALQHQIAIESLTSPDNNLQAVFEYLTTKKGPRGAAKTNGTPGSGRPKPSRTAATASAPAPDQEAQS